MHNIGIIVNHSKDIEFELTKSIINWIEKNNANPMLTKQTSAVLGHNINGYNVEEVYEKSDFVIVLGGDGTILQVAREIANFETPILGINLGHVGFLAEVDVKDIYKSLDIVLKGEAIIEERMMLEASIIKDNVKKEFYALNDIIITRNTISRILTMDAYINEDLVMTVNGDGLIVATPTGSTAYSLSAGGPIVSPNLSVITLTPICPHSFSNRSIVLSDNEVISIRLLKNSGDAYLTIDGQECYKIEKDEDVTVKKACFKTKLIKLPGRGFYDVLREKLKER